MLYIKAGQVGTNMTALPSINQKEKPANDGR